MAEGVRLQLSLTQVVASALAAISAAVAASFIGAYGTIIGAGLVSVVSTAGAAVYEHSMKRTRERLQQARITTVGRGRLGQSDASAEEGDQDGRLKRSSLSDLRRAVAGKFGALRELTRKPGWWKGIAGVSVLVFAIAVGVITSYELLAGKTLTATVTGTENAGSTSSVRSALSGEGGGWSQGDESGTRPDGEHGGPAGDGSDTGTRPGDTPEATRSPELGGPAEPANPVQSSDPAEPVPQDEAPVPEDAPEQETGGDGTEPQPPVDEPAPEEPPQPEPPEQPEAPQHEAPELGGQQEAQPESS